jgi:hypothetical protein
MNIRYTACVCRLVPVIASLLLFSVGPVRALDHMSIPIGIFVEHNFYNQFGVSAGFSDDRILKGHPLMTLSYSTSRLSTMTGSNGLKKDNFLLNAGWHFRPLRWIDPYLGIETGWTHFDREEDQLFAKLDNTGFLLDARVGIESTIIRGLFHVRADMGYAVVTSSTVFPLLFCLGLEFDIAKGLLK